MKLALALGVILLICAIGSTRAGPTEKPAATATTPKQSLKDTIKAAKKAKECVRDCGTQYNPVCGHDPSDTKAKPISFGSECVLNNHNCEHGTKLQVKAKGKCPDSEGIRLS